MGALGCPVCGSADNEVYLDSNEETLDAGLIGSSRRSTAPGRILRCRVCGFGFRETRFAAQQLAELYRHMDAGMYQSEMEGRRRTGARHLQIVERFARRGRLLDVGCASGVFLSLAAEAGWEATGVEPSETLSQQAADALAGRGAIYGTILEEASLPPAHYDAVTLWDVLEHVPDPLAMLRQCSALLKPGGLLFLNVPDLDSLQARLLGRRWPLLLAEHLNYFNRPSLRRCAAAAGLEAVHFDRRRAFFSAGYVCYRLAQHDIPGARWLERRLPQSIGSWAIPVSLGETWAVWRGIG